MVANNNGIMSRTETFDCRYLTLRKLAMNTNKNTDLPLRDLRQLIPCLVTTNSLNQGQFFDGKVPTITRY